MHYSSKLGRALREGFQIIGFRVSGLGFQIIGLYRGNIYRVFIGFMTKNMETVV